MDKIIFFIVMSSFTTGVFAQELNKEKMDSLFNKLENKDKAMGSLSIFKDGAEIYSRTIGFADIENKHTADSNTKYRIGSVTKTFTAVMVMKMIEEKKIDLSSKLSSFYPELPNAQKISIKNLLDHSSGLFNITASEDYADFMTEGKSKEEILDLIKRNGKIFEPGERNEYSNTNYILLTYILEDLGGRSYPELLQDLIVKPLNLTNTSYGGEIDVLKNEALSYKFKNSWVKAEETDLSIPLGAGGIISTPYDLNVFITALFNEKILKKITLSKMIHSEKGYGLGLFKFPFSGKISYGHDGNIDGFSSTSVYFPVQKLTLSYTSNASDVSVNEIMIGILSIYFDKDYQIPEFPDAIEISLHELKKYTGIYHSDNFPVDLEISLKNNILEMGEMGKNGFPLTPYKENVFRYDPAGISVKLDVGSGEMIFNQGDHRFHFSKSN